VTARGGGTGVIIIAVILLVGARLLTSCSLPLMFLDILFWNAFHTINLNLNIRSIRQSIWYFIYCFFMHLHTMNRKAWSSI